MFLILEYGNDYHIDKYRFYISDSMTLELDSYITFDRKTKRHKWVLEKQWDRVMTRDNKMDKPILSDQVYLEALNKYIKSIKIIK